MNREQIVRVSELGKELKKLIAYFNAEGYSRFGYRGDGDNLTPVDTAIRAMREYDALLRTDLGSAALNAKLYADVVAKGLVPS